MVVKTPRAMEKLVNWLNRATENKTIRPLLMVAVFVVSFWRFIRSATADWSRILTTLLLFRFGYKYDRTRMKLK